MIAKISITEWKLHKEGNDFRPLLVKCYISCSLIRCFLTDRSALMLSSILFLCVIKILFKMRSFMFNCKTSF